MKKYLIFIVFIFITTWSTAQTNQNFYIGGGLTQQSTRESRFTSNFRQGLGQKVLMGYEKNTLKRINKIDISFNHVNIGEGNISRAKSLQPEIRYEHLRLLKNPKIALGSYVDIGTILSFRNNWASDSYLSYCIWNSVGLSGRYQKTIALGGRTLIWQTQASMPIVSYLIRPSYTFPYTDNYLENGVFQLDQTGLAGKIITGGSLVLPHKFSNIRFQTALFLPTTNQKWSFGLNYAFDFLRTNEVKPILQTNHSLTFIIKRTK